MRRGTACGCRASARSWSRWASWSRWRVRRWRREHVSLGVAVSLAGALLTLYGALRGLGVHGGITPALLPPDFHQRRREVGRWFRERWRWFRRVILRRPVLIQVNLSDTATITDSIQTSWTVHTPPLPDITMDPAGFAGAVYGHMDRLGLELSRTKTDLDRERRDREAAVQSARDDLASAAAAALEHSKTVELSGIRWQVFGAAVVVLGIVIDLVFG